MATLNMERMKKLGLKALLEEKYSDEGALQVAMAKKLRELTFQYLSGNLANIVADGPEVKTLRAALKENGSMDSFIQSQSSNKAWATYLELTLLAELTQVNFAVKMSKDSDIFTVLTANPNAKNPTVIMHNERNTHWSAHVSGAKKDTLADGNCGYNAFALSLTDLAPEKPVYSQPITTREQVFADDASTTVMRLKQEESRLNGSLQNAQRAEQEFNNAMVKIYNRSPEKHLEIQKQIHSDYLFALKLAVSELPDEAGLTNHPVGVLATIRTNERYINQVAAGLLGNIPNSTQDEEPSGPRPGR